MHWIQEKHLFLDMKNLIEIKNLSIGFQSQLSKKNVVNSISFNISSKIQLDILSVLSSKPIFKWYNCGQNIRVAKFGKNNFDCPY